jgi:hypothetical protein
MAKEDFMSYALARLEDRKKKDIERKKQTDRDFVNHLVAQSQKSYRRARQGNIFKRGYSWDYSRGGY